MLSDLTIAMIQPGSSDRFPDGHTHQKVAPSIIVCQPTIGRYEMRCRDQYGIAGPGDVFLACAGDPLHIVHHHDPEEGRMVARWVHITFLLYETIDVSSFFTVPVVYAGSECREWGEIIQEFLDRRNDAGLLWTVRRQQLAFRLLALLLDVAEFEEERLRPLQETERLQPVFAFVKENLAASLTIDDLAHAANLSRSRFHTFFREHMQCTPMDYVKTVRLQEAQRLMMTTDWALSEIAEQVGFTNQLHFSREFKARNGVAPSVYRQQHQDGLL